MADLSIIEKLVNVTNEFLGGKFKDETEEVILHSILSDSAQTINFIVALEDEFDIEFDDDDLNIQFFSSYNSMAETISKYFGENKKGGL